MHILITGIAGFVGSSVASQLILSGHRITGIDNFSSGSFRLIKDISDQVDLLVGNMENILTNHAGEYDAIINCAATAPLPNNEVDHFSSMTNNAATCGALMQFANRNQVRKVIHFSSSAVYEGLTNNEDVPLHEKMELAPKLMYPFSKWMSEQYVATQAEIHSIPTFTLRLFNLYGPNQDYYRSQPPLLGYLFKSLILNEEATIYGTKDARRDYININDLISFIEVLLIRNPQNKMHDIINVGSGKAYDVYDIISVIQKVTGKTLKYKADEPKRFWEKYQKSEGRQIRLPSKLLENEVRKVAHANIKKAIQYGLEINTTMECGISECYEIAKEKFK